MDAKYSVFLAIPVVVAFSLCYAGTRHERPAAIFLHALRFAFWSFTAMLGIIVALELLRYLTG